MTDDKIIPIKSSIKYCGISRIDERRRHNGNLAKTKGDLHAHFIKFRLKNRKLDALQAHSVPLEIALRMLNNEDHHSQLPQAVVDLERATALVKQHPSLLSAFSKDPVAKMLFAKKKRRKCVPRFGQSRPDIRNISMSRTFRANDCRVVASTTRKDHFMTKCGSTDVHLVN